VTPLPTLFWEQGSGATNRSRRKLRNCCCHRCQEKKTRPVGAVYREIALDAIRPNEQQPRQNFDEEVLNELVHSIREFGLLQPIVVREIAPKAYEIIMGERRWRAAQRADLETIPAIVRQTDDSAMLRDALLENIHRVQLNHWKKLLPINSCSKNLKLLMKSWQIAWDALVQSLPI